MNIVGRFRNVLSRGRKNTVCFFATYKYVILIVAVYIALYVLNVKLPLSFGLVTHFADYTSRIWGWTMYAIGLASTTILFIFKKRINRNVIPFCLNLAFLSGVSHFFRSNSVFDLVFQTVVTALALIAGHTLFQEVKDIKVAAFEGEPKQIGKSILWGVAFSLPFALLNNYYFFTQKGFFQIQNLAVSAFHALNPAITEEIVFRYFLIAAVSYTLRGKVQSRIVMLVAIFVAVLPHSLNHLPDLFLTDPAAAIFMTISTCILFGLPMAWLQIKRNLETAIGFHWFIDFARFVMGF